MSLSVVFNLFLLMAPVAAQVRPEMRSNDDEIITTQHQITLAGGRKLSYTARAGRLPILDNDTGEAHGHIFFTAYIVEPGLNQPVRPLMFLWNGGPGSSSSLVHLLGFGPRRLEPDGTAVDNQGTWLDHTDLVFVDPVGTGYSRPARPEYGAEFYQNRGDAESVAEFIRVYRNRFECWDAPLFLTGESFGVVRAAGVAEVLERRNIPLDGVILIGLALPLGSLSTEMRSALMVPTYTAAAYTNKKLSSDLQGNLEASLQKSAEWARKEYGPALVKRDGLSETERQAIAAQLARYTGMDAAKIDTKTLTIGMEQFSQQLLSDRNLVVGRYDSRLVGRLDPEEKIYDPTKDPSLKNIINDVGVVRYFRRELQYRSDLQYQGPFGGGYPPPTSFRGDWMSVRWNRPAASSTPPPAGGQNRQNAPSSVIPADQPLRRAMASNRNLQVMSVCGYYDLVCAYEANSYVASSLEPDVARRVTAKGYGGGHALYTDKVAQLEMKRDVVSFLQKAMSARRGSNTLKSQQK